MAKNKVKLKSALKIKNFVIDNDTTAGFKLKENNSKLDKFKNVRFDLNSTTIKKFDSSLEPIIISKNDESPISSPILFSIGTDFNETNENNIDNSDSFWFNDLNVLPDLVKIDKKFNYFYKRYKSHNNRTIINNHYAYNSESDNESKYDSFHLKNYNKKSFHTANDLTLSDFDLDDDYDNEDDYSDDEEEDMDYSYNYGESDDYQYFDTDSNYGFLGKNEGFKKNDGNNNDNNENLKENDNFHWKLFNTDIDTSLNKIDLNNITESEILDILRDQNIKLVKLEQIDDFSDDNNKIIGSLIVNNLNFEKNIEVKFTFNNWDNIHYINSQFKKSLTEKFDEFEFFIDLNRYKFFLKIKDLLNNQINISLCCRYDVNNETYYDNNNYQNYNITLTKIVKTKHINMDGSLTSQSIIPILNNIPKIHANNNCTDFNYFNNNNGNDNDKLNRSKSTFINQNLYNFRNNYSVPLVSNTSFLKNKNYAHTRIFVEDTNYFNTSPLKHLYHNDTCEYIKKPATINEVLNIETSPSPIPDFLPEPTIASAFSKTDLFSDFRDSSEEANDFSILSSVPTSDLIPEAQNITSMKKSATSSKNLPTNETMFKHKKELNERNLSTISDFSVTSSTSSASLSSFQSDNITAKRSKDLLTSSFSSMLSDSTNSALITEKLKTIDTNISNKNFTSSYNYFDNLVSNTPDDTSVSSQSNDSTLTLNNRNKNSRSDLNNTSGRSSTSINLQNRDYYKLEAGTSSKEQDEIQSISTDTTFKNILLSKSMDDIRAEFNKSNNNSFNDPMVNFVKEENNFNNKDIMKDGIIKDMDYQTLLNSYCFYTTSQTNPTTTLPTTTLNQNTNITPNSSVFF